jgi:hypothetical protein
VRIYQAKELAAADSSGPVDNHDGDGKIAIPVLASIELSNNVEDGAPGKTKSA